MGIKCSSVSNKHHTQSRRGSIQSQLSRDNYNLEQKLNNYLFYNQTYSSKALRIIFDSNYCAENNKEYSKNRDKLITILQKQLLSNEHTQIKISMPITQLNRETNDKVQILKIFHYLKEREKDFFNKILEKGPPNEFRWLIYLTKALCSNYNYIYHNIYLNLVNQEISEDLELEIRKDLPRSWLEANEFNTENNLDILYNVLKAYANYDKELSYCSGMNTLAASLLILSNFNELEVFNIMCFLFSLNYNNNIRDFYLSGFPKLHFFSYLTRLLLKTHLKPIYKKCKEFNISDEIWIFRWIQSLYLLILPFSIIVRIWDCIFAHGIDFILNITIAFIGSFEKKIVKAKDLVDFLDCFKVKFKDDEELFTFREELIHNALKIKLDDLFLVQEKKNFDKKEAEKDKVNIYSTSKSMIPSNAMASTNDVSPVNMIVKSKNHNSPQERKIIKEVIQENYDLEVENDLEKIKIQWEMNSDNVDVKVQKDLDKSV